MVFVPYLLKKRYSLTRFYVAIFHFKDFFFYKHITNSASKVMKNAILGLAILKL